MIAIPRLRHLNRNMLLAAGTTGLVLATTGFASAQSFDSGSTGEDGAFVATPPPGSTDKVVEFDPRRIFRNNDPAQGTIDPERDNVFHFTTITIPSGVTLKMSARWTNGPVYLLAKGLPTMTSNDEIAVHITGTIEASGEHGADMSHSAAMRGPAYPGPGGYFGGLGGNFDGTNGSRGQNGLGRFGGLGAPSTFSGDRGQAAQGLIGGPQLVPLIGGSGGGAGNHGGLSYYGAGGGPGGGAILISSTRRIHMDASGRIHAGGGYGGHWNGCGSHFGGGGAGGSVRLVAPVLTGNGQIHNYPGLAARGHCGSGAPWAAPAGRTRLEAFQNNQTYGIPYGTASNGSPLSSFVPTTPPPVLQVTKINQQDVTTDPSGKFDTADITINEAGPVTLTITAKNVPVVSGNNVPTVPTLYLFSLEDNDKVLDADDGMTALSGNFSQSTSTVSVTLPPGFTRGYVRASWTVP